MERGILALGNISLGEHDAPFTDELLRILYSQILNKQEEIQVLRTKEFITIGDDYLLLLF